MATLRWAPVSVVFAFVCANAWAGDEVSPTEEEAPLFEVGALVGGGLFQINTPADPTGSVTFLYGSAFSGGGFMLGGTATYRAQRLFGLQSDLLYSYSSIMGFAESESFRREVDFGEHALRLSLVAKFNIALSLVCIELGLGPELVWTVGAVATETLTGFEAGSEPSLQVGTTVTLMPTAQIGVTFDLGAVRIPVFFRFGWNPFYPDTTEERFDAFNGPDDPGRFVVGVDWYVVALAGVRFGL